MNDKIAFFQIMKIFWRSRLWRWRFQKKKSNFVNNENQNKKLLRKTGFLKAKVVVFFSLGIMEIDQNQGFWTFQVVAVRMEVEWWFLSYYGLLGYFSGSTKHRRSQTYETRRISMTDDINNGS